MNLLDFSIYCAAVVLGMIILANFIAPGKLGYAGNLARVDDFFGEVFRVHCGYTMLTMSGMLLACVFYHAELKGNEGWGLVLIFIWLCFGGAGWWCRCFITIKRLRGNTLCSM